MGLSFANSAAAWALLGVPVVLAIHFLQSRCRRVEISTLFLLDVLPEETRRGAVFTRLRNGLQLWLQLLAVLLLSLLLARPMWLRRESVQNVGVVVDASLSMQAFLSRAQPRLDQDFRRIQRAAGLNEWIILPADPALPPIYRGDDVDAALAALAAFVPRSPGQDPRPTLLRARELIGPEGLLLFVTDHPPETAPGNAVVLGVGEPLNNSAFGGIRFENNEAGETVWHSSVLHFGSEAANTTLRLIADGKESEARPLQISPGAVLGLRGVLPPGVLRGKLRLGDDALAGDNEIPFVVPTLKIITWTSALNERADVLARRVMSTVPAVEENTSPILSWRSYDGALPEASGHGIFFPLPGENAAYAQVVAEDHELMRDLSWSGFLGRPRSFAATRPGDQPLLWMGEVPLVLLRETASAKQLVFTFDPAESNLERLPAFVLLIHRFCERIRAELDQPEARLLETRQRFRSPPGETRQRFEDMDGNVSEGPVSSQTPDVPGFLQIWRGVDRRLDAAVLFGDVAESDLRQAASTELPSDLILKRREQNSETDFLSSLWFLILVACIAGSWGTAKT